MTYLLLATAVLYAARHLATVEHRHAGAAPAPDAGQYAVGAVYGLGAALVWPATLLTHATRRTAPTKDTCQ
ncbi:hypothetical protein [Streptomyces aidingensis]|uniref:Uncharacterized protein n=1 Tax=Streptomyces aidingensis TaxID=910347 RepID=A0A1I1PUM8_9ACTN|nr:hypothetical protein [Streptomyces aidingensis]SFD13644.1 hypothetical protein SAMN05421773_11069 [Streptomyces aidingensis]